MEVIGELRKIYGCLSDEESREIFRLKMEYLLTGDYHSIEAITNKFLPQMQTAPIYPVEKILELSGTRPIVCYGAGDNASFFADYWRGFPSGKIAAFCDQKKELQRTGFLRYKVISPEQLKAEYKDVFVVISSTIYCEEIKNNLLPMGFSSDQILTQIFPPLLSAENQYFDPSIIRFDKDGEIYVDGGSMDLSSVRNLSRLTNVKKAYAFEPNHEHFKRCEKIKADIGFDIRLYQMGLWSEKAELRFEPREDGGSQLNDDGSEIVNVCSLEDVVGTAEKVTFIKMDIEGAELEALKGCQNIIKRDRPKLAICIYHKPEDMYEIPLFIKNLVPEYRLYIRHYSNRQFETVLYAVM